MLTRQTASAFTGPESPSVVYSTVRMCGDVWWQPSSEPQARQALNVSSRLQAQILESGENKSQAGVCSGLCLPQFSGIWYTKAMVSDKDRPEGKGPKKVFPIRVTSLEGGDLELIITYL